MKSKTGRHYLCPTRLARILKLHADGLTSTVIGERMGLSASRVWQVIKDAKEGAKNDKKE
jgi:DNA-binding NarL/FixJ family response regulator